MVDAPGALARAARRARGRAAAVWARAGHRGRTAVLAVVAAAVAALVVTAVLVPAPDPSRASAAASADGRGTTGEHPDADPGRPAGGSGGRPGGEVGDRGAGSGAGRSAGAAPRPGGRTPTARPRSGPPGSPTTGPTADPGADPGAPVATGAVGVVTPSPSAVGQEVALGALRATVVSVGPVVVGARGPGEIAGPGAAVRLRVRNDSSSPADLAGLAVTAASPDGVPAVPSSGEPAEPLAGPLPPGEQRSGTYVFALPAGSRGAPSLRVEVGSDTAREVAVVLAP